MQKKKDKDKYVQMPIHLPPSQKRSLEIATFKAKKTNPRATQSHFVREGLKLQGIV